MVYIAPDLSLDVVLLEQLVVPTLPLDVIMCEPIVSTQTVGPKAFQSSVVSNLLIVKNPPLFLLPQSIQSEIVSSSLDVRISNNNLGLVVLDQRGVYPDFIWGVVLRQKGEVDVDIALTAYSFDAGSIPKNHRVELSIRTIAADGIPSNSGFGRADLYGNRQFVSSIGFYATAFGLASTVNVSRQLWAKSFTSSLFSKPLIYNLKQFAPAQGKDQSSYGTPYLQGGVRWINAIAIAPPNINNPVVTNTTANQYAYPSGITSKLVVPAPTVTPHTIWVSGIAQGGVGYPVVIPTPVLRHRGVNHFEAGKTTIWYHTRTLSPNGFESYATGYPKVFDPTQFIQPSAFNRTAVFGDTYAKNVWTFVKGAGAIDSAVVSPWSVVENKNRRYIAKGFLSQAFGNQSIKNKSPSIFFNGLPAPAFPSQAIGYRIRKIAPTGFDRLGLGNPTVIKTPELKPNGLVATKFGTQWASNRTRYIEQYGKDYSATGTPIVWFRFRYAYPNAWQSSTFGDKLTITHGVREVIGQGFIQQGYGIAWVSRGTRLIEPRSIYKEFATNHLVGRKQEILPVGYVATLWGTRIIPESQSLYPLGFAGVWGLTTISLYTQYIKPAGYISVGQQPADRWGNTVFYNSVQYIIQNFDGGSGLVPPKWSDWQSIENRNKVIGVTGFASQKFGYSQIDNNAAQLSPKGIEPPVSNATMISHGVRYLPLDGIEPPLMSTWAVVYNGARVIAPAGRVQTLSGLPSVVNTRREYRNIGRIDSLEMGEPTIGYRIRTINIEPRYSIAPPYIQLPTVELYTRYVSFQGYETAKYGLPALSIHLRIIAPKWVHRDKHGTPALHNVTPEILVNGHNSNEYGQASIRTQWRHVTAIGDNANIFGVPRISDTKQAIEVRGWLDTLVGQQPVVTKTGTNPYVTQNIWLNDESGTHGGQGDGIRNDNNFGTPFFNQNVLYHRGHQSSKFGTIFMWSNNIVVDGGIAIDGVSKGAVVSNRNNIISSVGGIASTIALGKPRLSPHTIWAVMEAPEQAKRNHGATGLHYVGGFGGGQVGAVVGRPSVESTIRTVYPFSILSSNFGRPELDLSLKIIKPQSFRLSRFGIPSIPFTPQEIVLRDGIHDPQWGSAKVDRPPYTGPQTIAVKGFNEFRSGQHYSDNFIRTLAALGRDSLDMGYSRGNDNPFMWQSLRVGAHIPTSIGAGDTSLYGTPTIWHRVRGIELDGFNAFASGYELSNFRERMTVANADKQLPAIKNIAAIGIEPSNAFGVTDLRYGQHFIRPDGNSDQFRKGGYHA